MAAEFEEFTRAIARTGRSGLQEIDSIHFENVTVLGGGIDALQFAALSLAENRSVTLFSAYGAELKALRKAGGITIRGDGPVGTYQVDQASMPSIRTTAELDTAVNNADLIFMTGPIHKHRTYAMVLADHLADGQTLVIAPGRTFGSIESNWLLQVGGCRADIAIVEVQNLPFWAAQNNSALNLSACEQTTAAVMTTSKLSNLNALQSILPNIKPCQNVLHSSFADASGAVEAVALAIGNSLIARNQASMLPGAEPLEERNTFRALLEGERCRDVIEQLLQERRNVARLFGVRNLPDSTSWIEASAGTISGSGSRPVPTQPQAFSMLSSAVIGSLIPLQSAGLLSGVPTPVTDSVVTLAGTLLKRDFPTAGRRLENMGIDGNGLDEVRRQIESVMKGN